jgi:hypothetical protein
MPDMRSPGFQRYGCTLYFTVPGRDHCGTPAKLVGRAFDRHWAPRRSLIEGTLRLAELREVPRGALPRLVPELMGLRKTDRADHQLVHRADMDFPLRHGGIYRRQWPDLRGVDLLAAAEPDAP